MDEQIAIILRALEHEYIFGATEADLRIVLASYHRDGWTRFGATHRVAEQSYLQMVVRIDREYLAERGKTLVVAETPAGPAAEPQTLCGFPVVVTDDGMELKEIILGRPGSCRVEE